MPLLSTSPKFTTTYREFYTVVEKVRNDPQISNFEKTQIFEKMTGIDKIVNKIMINELDISTNDIHSINGLIENIIIAASTVNYSDAGLIITGLTKLQSSLEKILSNTNSDRDQYTKTQSMWMDLQILSDRVKSDIDQLNDAKKEVLAELNLTNTKALLYANEIASIKENVEKELKDLQTKYSRDLEKYEAISQTVGFVQSSERSKKSSVLWGTIIVIVLISLFVFIGILMRAKWYDINSIHASYLVNSKVSLKFSQTLLLYELIVRALLRTILLTVLLLALRFSIKNYNASMHSHAINEHKANSYDSALIVMTSLPDDDSRKTFLSEAGKEIFAQHKTGYLNKEGEGININLLKDLASIFKS